MRTHNTKRKEDRRVCSSTIIIIYVIGVLGKKKKETQPQTGKERKEV